MASDSHNGTGRPALRLDTAAFSSVVPESRISPATPLSAGFRRRSIPSLPQADLAKTPQLMQSISEKASPASELSEAEAFPVLHPSDKLSIWKRYFCAPIDKDEPSRAFDADNRAFSFATRGFVISAMLVSMLLSAIIAPAVALTIDKRARTAGPKGSIAAAAAAQINAATAPVYSPVPNSPVNQAIQSNYPDPFILQYQSTWYAFATNNAIGVLGSPSNVSGNPWDGKNVQIATSSDFTNWDVLPNATSPLPTVGAWAGQLANPPTANGARPAVWAPSVFQRTLDNKFVMYYAARARGQGETHCLGAAVSTTDSPLGPYNPLNISFACPLSQGGAIDAAPFIDPLDNSTYIVYKIDGNSKGNGGQCANSIKPIHNTPIMLQKVLSDGVTPDGDPVQILDRTADDGPLVEAPSLIKTADGTYFLFFSSGCTRDPSYDVKYAYSTTLTGPYTRAPKRLLKTGNYNLTAPGSVTVTQSSSGQWVMAFHARVKTAVGGVREMFTTGLTFTGTNITITTM